jgi:hypothetical protein
MAIRWDKFTVKAQEAVQNASQLAAESGNPEILPLHLLAVLHKTVITIDAIKHLNDHYI